MGQGLRLQQGANLSQSLAQFVGETSGDIPIYSLHKISTRLRKTPILMSAEVGIILNRALVAANATYKAESGNDWNCLTSNNLVDALESVEQTLRENTENALRSIPGELAAQRHAAKELLDRKLKELMDSIKEWFRDNYDALSYNTDGKIPWPIVQRLRRNLGLWIMGTANIFHQDIEEMVEEVAAEAGISADSAEEAWEAMGGKLSR